MDVLLQDLRQALGHDESELGSVSRVRGVVVMDPAGSFALTLEVADGERRSSRSFASRECADLARAAALAIALAAHPAPNDPGPTVSDEVLAAPETDSGSNAEVANAASQPRNLSWSGGASAVLDVGALPEPATGLGVTARAAVAPFELDVHGLLLPSQRRAVAAGDSVELGLMALGLRGCARLLERPLVVGGCLAAEAGRYTATGVGLSPGRELHDLWIAVGPGVLARTAFAGPLQLELLGEPLLALARKQYAVNATDVVHSPAMVDLRLQVGLIIGSAGGAGP